MAARDETYRNQRILDIVFAVSSVALLVSLVWMIYKDENREYKEVQEKGFEVEVAVLRRQAHQSKEANKAQLEAAQKELNDLKAKGGDPARIAQLQDEINAKQPDFVKLEKGLANLKDEKNSLVSERDILVQEKALESAIRKKEEEIKNKDKQLAETEAKLIAVQREIDRLDRDIAAERVKQLNADEKKQLADLEKRVKDLTADQDRLARTADEKELDIYARLRALPFVNAFASPYKVRQDIPEGLLINYNFKQVQRVDRCATCHMFIDRPGFDKAKLLELAQEPYPGAPKDLTVQLTPAEIAVYAGHPHLDLYLSSSSPHPVEKFGCTICHAGQGGSATFNFAYHFPDGGKTDGKDLEVYAEKRDRWTKDRHWHADLHPDFLWDYPMYPQRFIESTCLKCHHQVTDLIKTDGTETAPKVLKGYRLVRDLGCYGCHEIGGFKTGRPVGPDMRLEPYPPLEAMSPLERSQLLSNPNDPPGDMRKVGPGLRRIAEKTNPEWTVKWIRSPRAFRPDTRMPHFFGQQNNTPDKLSDYQNLATQLPEEQKGLPDAEIQAATFYLFQASKNVLASPSNGAPWPPYSPPWESLPYPPRDLLETGGNGKEVAYKADVTRGKKLFIERGCLACHSLESVNDPNKGVEGTADFGPNLASLRDKLGSTSVKPDKWLYYWLENPSSYHARTFMPAPQLDPKDAAKNRADIAAFLLSDEAYVPPPKEWNDVKVGQGDMVKLARVYIDKALLVSEKERDAATKEGIPDDMVQFMRPDADERLLAKNLPADSPVAKLGFDERLKFYAGRKTIGKYGCYGCHDISGFETSKPIGTPLNDWGVKDPERLAFENIVDYVKKHHEHLDPFFKDAIEANRRDGFLHQKLLEPRSYDYDKLRTWDERLRMPQFQFAQTPLKPGETRDSESYKQRHAKEEDENIEAVMTFVLGLVADPVPMRFVNQPATDRLNEVKGTKLLEKYNCIGCHVAKAGVYEFALAEPVEVAGERRTMQEQLLFFYNLKEKERALDINFPESTAWNSYRAYPPGRVIARGLPIEQLRTEDGKLLGWSVELWEAIRFPDTEGKTLQFAAGLNQVAVPANPNMNQHGPYGGDFANLLVSYSAQRDRKDVVLDRGLLWGTVPPPLIREGSKVQADWLLDFVQKPHVIRPMVANNLRMPRFNMSPDEAEALVRYFVAVDRLENPGEDLQYLNPRPPQRFADFMPKIADFAPMTGERTDYLDYGWKIITNKDNCVKCHQVGKLQIAGAADDPLVFRGPPLDQAADRLRPAYLQRWISDPLRLVPYTRMTQNDAFYRNQMGPPVSLQPAWFKKPPLPAFPVDFNQPLFDFYRYYIIDLALTPEERLRAVRDALMSWGYLPPTPIVEKEVGPRGGPQP